MCLSHDMLNKNPSAPHTIMASGRPHKLPCTVPQTPLLHISTRPSWYVLPPTSLRSPCVQFPEKIDYIAFSNVVLV